eukprot:TRINITY_DN16546_c0_g3_i1.p1 TRINITY_DN16546_c0_g3~~TRINITY_DN16546_c0_g3_i1.p1  ORF type:complete len:489 (+),score=97.33 TRINITY_DN16546_c0_g3_i1:39-1469(+)
MALEAPHCHDVYRFVTPKYPRQRAHTFPSRDADSAASDTDIYDMYDSPEYRRSKTEFFQLDDEHTEEKASRREQEVQERMRALHAAGKPAWSPPVGRWMPSFPAGLLHLGLVAVGFALSYLWPMLPTLQSSRGHEELERVRAELRDLRAFVTMHSAGMEATAAVGRDLERLRFETRMLKEAVTALTGLESGFRQAPYGVLASPSGFQGRLVPADPAAAFHNNLERILEAAVDADPATKFQNNLEKLYDELHSLKTMSHSVDPATAARQEVEKMQHAVEDGHADAVAFQRNFRSLEDELRSLKAMAVEVDAATVVGRELDRLWEDVRASPDLAFAEQRRSSLRPISVTTLQDAGPMSFSVSPAPASSIGSYPLVGSSVSAAKAASVFGENATEDDAEEDAVAREDIIADDDMILPGKATGAAASPSARQSTEAAQPVFGNPACWQGGFSWDNCCHDSFGPAGNPACWDEYFNASTCC